MAQPQAQSKRASSVNPLVTNTLPATRDRRGSLVPRELRSWAASPFSMLPGLSDDMDQLQAGDNSRADTVGRRTTNSLPDPSPSL
jgi:hypothetical protein